MSVQLISYTHFANDIILTLGLDENEIAHDEFDPNLTHIICYIARVSNPTNQCNTLNNNKLINYLITHNHWSPFEMVNITIKINTTRDIARQILRHRSFSFQEFSQRYAIPDLSAITCREPRLQDNKNRQNSIDTDNEELINKWNSIQTEIYDKCTEAYNWAIENNIAKEQSRVVLPEGLTPSTLYMNGTLRSWIHYIKIRTATDVQKEHRHIAELCRDEIYKIFPFTI
jgi:thymidylate synthase (FAD)